MLQKKLKPPNEAVKGPTIRREERKSEVPLEIATAVYSWLSSKKFTLLGIIEASAYTSGTVSSSNLPELFST